MRERFLPAGRRRVGGAWMLRAVAAAMACSAASPTATEAALVSAPTRPQTAESIPFETVGVASGPYSVLEMLYERTIFRVDVLRLRMRVGERTASSLRQVVEGNEYDDALVARVVGLVLEADEVLVSSQFLRDVSFEDLMDGIADNLSAAQDAGYLTAEQLDPLLVDIAVKYAPIRERGVRANDTIWYHVRGDTFRVAVRTFDGAALVDSTSTGALHRRALLGGYLAPRSDFREGLVRSLLGHDAN